MKTNKEYLHEIFNHLNSLEYIRPEQIPDIDLYMDQVTTFMDEHLGASRRYPDDKVLTKTMINNYAKNNLLPPPVKKKYSKEHMLMLIFIYYFKNLLSFNDIETLFSPITKEHFKDGSGLSLEDIYEQILSMEYDQMKALKEDMIRKFQTSEDMFTDQKDDKDRDYLQLFAFICELGFDVYLKRQTIEFLIDEIRKDQDKKEKEEKKRR